MRFVRDPEGVGFECLTNSIRGKAASTTYLGIDVGTSATKAVILTSDGTVVARSRVPHPAARGAGAGRADPSAWRASITAAVRELAPHTATVVGVGMDTHCPTALLLDECGVPLVPGVTWDHPGLAEPTAALIAALSLSTASSSEITSSPAHRNGAALPAATGHRTPSRHCGGHIRTRRNLVGPMADRRTRHRPHTGVLHRADGQHRWILPLARRGRRSNWVSTSATPPVRPSPRAYSASCAAASAATPWTAPGHSGDRRLRRHASRLVRAGNEPGGRPC